MPACPCGAPGHVPRRSEVSLINFFDKIRKLDAAVEKMVENGAVAGAWKLMQIKIQICQLFILAKICEILEKTK